MKKIQKAIEGKEFNLSTIEQLDWNEDDYFFEGWSEDELSEEPEYSDGEKVTFNNNKELFGVWKGRIDVEFDRNQYEVNIKNVNDESVNVILDGDYLEYRESEYPYNMTFPFKYMSEISNANDIVEVKDDLSSVKYIGDYAFYNCRNISSVSFPECEEIGQESFAEDILLADISFPKLKRAGSWAFEVCTSLVTASFPQCTSIGEEAFCDCSSLTTASFPQCTSIGSYAFHYCTSLTTASFPQCTTIDYVAFAYCTSLTTASFPQCTSIGEDAFNNCSSLTTASFPQCTSIGDRAFYNCSLTTASFPQCTSIGRAAFYECSSLREFYIGNKDSLSVATLGINVFKYYGYPSYTILPNLTAIHVPMSLSDAYRSATNWSEYASIIKGYNYQ